MLSIVLNEVLYDPPGADSGREYVELAAPAGADTAASLAGWAVQTGNGAQPGVWKVAWVGAPGDRLRGGLFLIGEAGVQPAPDAVADLDLQNGPDACRLVGPAGEEDRLGWGTPLAPSFFEGTPAPDVSGLALARLPDGVDTDRNSADFLAAAPSPGAFNAPPTAFVVERFTPPAVDLAAGASGDFAWDVRSVGRLAARAEVLALCSVHPGEVLAAASTGLLAPGQRAAVSARAAPPPGVHLPRSDPPAPPSGNEAAWAGGGVDVVVMEAMSRPRSGEPEWIELQSVTDRAVDLAAFTLRDASGSVGRPAGVLAPGGLAVVAPDTAAVAARWRVPAAVLLAQPDSWPSLNHTASAGEAAERILLLVGDREGDVAELPGGAKEGVSWERVSRHVSGADPAAWTASADPAGGTPGRRNSVFGDRGVSAPVVGAVRVEPSPFVPRRDGSAVIVFRLSKAVTACRMTVFDSRGVPVRRLAPWSVGGGEHRALWDGRMDGGESAPLGLYIVRAEAPGVRAARVSLPLVR